MIPDPQALTDEGYDLQFGVNVVGGWFISVLIFVSRALGHCCFTRLLIPQLLAAGSSRIITLSSHGHILAKGINWETIRDGPARQKTESLDLYNQSKFVSNFESSFSAAVVQPQLCTGQCCGRL